MHASWQVAAVIVWTMITNDQSANAPRFPKLSQRILIRNTCKNKTIVLVVRKACLRYY